MLQAAQNLCFGNGPFITVSTIEDEILIQAYRPSWMQVESLRIQGGNGLTFAEWPFQDVMMERRIARPNSNWLSAEIVGTHWAIHIIR